MAHMGIFQNHTFITPITTRVPPLSLYDHYTFLGLLGAPIFGGACNAQGEGVIEP